MHINTEKHLVVHRGTPYVHAPTPPPFDIDQYTCLRGADELRCICYVPFCTNYQSFILYKNNLFYKFTYILLFFACSLNNLCILIRALYFESVSI